MRGLPCEYIGEEFVGCGLDLRGALLVVVEVVRDGYGGCGGGEEEGGKEGEDV